MYDIGSWCTTAVTENNAGAHAQVKNAAYQVYRYPRFLQACKHIHKLYRVFVTAAGCSLCPCARAVDSTIGGGGGSYDISEN